MSTFLAVLSLLFDTISLRYTLTRVSWFVGCIQWDVGFKVLNFSFHTGRRRPALHAPTQKPALAAPQYENHSNDRRLLLRGLQGRGRDLSNPQWVCPPLDSPPPTFFFSNVTWFVLNCPLLFLLLLVRHPAFWGTVPAPASGWSIQEEEKKREKLSAGGYLGHWFSQRRARGLR